MANWNVAANNMVDVLDVQQQGAETQSNTAEIQTKQVLDKLRQGGMNGDEAKAALEAIKLMSGESASLRRENSDIQKERLRLALSAEMNGMKLTSPNILQLREKAVELNMLGAWESAVKNLVEVRVNRILTDNKSDTLNGLQARVAELTSLQTELNGQQIVLGQDQIRTELANAEDALKNIEARNDFEGKSEQVTKAMDLFREDMQDDLRDLEAGVNMNASSYFTDKGILDLEKVRTTIESLATGIGLSPDLINKMIAGGLRIAAEAAEAAAKMINAKMELIKAEKELKLKNKEALKKGLKIGLGVVSGGAVLVGGYGMVGPLLTTLLGRAAAAGLTIPPGLNMGNVFKGAGGIGLLLGGSKLIDGFFKGYDLTEGGVKTLTGKGNVEMKAKIYAAKNQVTAAFARAQGEVERITNEVTVEIQGSLRQDIRREKLTFATF